MMAGITLVVYGAHCFGVLMESTKHMSQGNLETKVDDTLIVGAFQEFAKNLNDLADVSNKILTFEECDYIFLA